MMPFADCAAAVALAVLPQPTVTAGVPQLVQGTISCQDACWQGVCIATRQLGHAQGLQ